MRFPRTNFPYIRNWKVKRTTSRNYIRRNWTGHTQLAERGPEAPLSLPERPDTLLEIIDPSLLVATSEVEGASALPERTPTP
ncbi:hypothetical protein TNCT_605881 [Trichonephila clavata]|uniref:Uncharacterized protein n=1 Tax=Trichonephila clavata TaxID=2740835 RepID=A0A8X6F2J1_TRICU|nr:hypothetical protein TNCT_605881 [Trichonephila clavata]